MQAVDAIAFMFRDQLGLRLQPLLHLMSRQCAGVDVIEVGPFGDLIHGRLEAGFILALVDRRRRFTGRALVAMNVILAYRTS